MDEGLGVAAICLSSRIFSTDPAGDRSPIYSRLSELNKVKVLVAHVFFCYAAQDRAKNLW